MIRRISLLFFVMAITFFANAQTIVFQESFENTTTNFTSSGTASWTRTSSYASEGTWSNKAQIIATNDYAIIESSAFSTIGNSNVILDFDHICKIEFWDKATIGVSIDNGSNWIQLNQTNYLGGSTFGSYGNYFASSTYQTWDPANSASLPDSTWWKSEAFDISTLVTNKAQVKIRFKVEDGNANGGVGSYGWLLDNVKVTMANGELIKPMIVASANNPIDTSWSAGPYDIFATITDASGIDSAKVHYTIGSTTSTLNMTPIGNDVYKTTIPSQAFGTSVCYSIQAIDSSSTANTISYPSNGCTSFYTVRPLAYSFIGDGQSDQYNAPFYYSSATSGYKYSQHMSLYTPDEIHNSGIIKRIAWEKANNGSYLGQNAMIQIYIKTTTKTSIGSSDNFATELSGATLVYQDSASSIGLQTGWNEFNFNKAHFNYSGTESIIVMVNWYRPASGAGAVPRWKYTTKTGSSITYYGSSVNPTSSTSNGNRPNTRFGLQSSVYPWDISLHKITSPDTTQLSALPVPFNVQIKNEGSNTVSKAYIDWSLDGVNKTQYVWTGSIAQDIVTPDFTVATYTLANGPHNVKLWTSNPNDSNDYKNYNDTISFDFYACNEIYNGSYTLGGTSADFDDFAKLMNGLNSCGMSGPVTILVNSGTYNESIFISDSIPGLSAQNTLTIESATGNANDVWIKSSTSSAKNYVISLHGAEYVTLKNLSIEALGSSYATAINLTNEASNNTILNCNLKSSTGNNNYARTIYWFDGGNNYNVIDGNTFINGYAAVYGYGSSTKKSIGNTISNNTISGFYSRAIYTSYDNDLTVKGNNIETVQASGQGTMYAIYISKNELGLDLSNNILNMEMSGAGYGLYLSYVKGDSAVPNLISNNMISLTGSSSSTACRNLYLSYSSNNAIVFNSFYNSAGQSATEAIYVAGSSTTTPAVGNKLINNNIAHYGGGYAIEYASSLNAATVIDSSDNNNYFTTGVELAKINGNPVTTVQGIAGITAQTSLDVHSISADPKFLLPTNLHSYSSVLNGAAIPAYSVITDIDGETRDGTNPDIGADEFNISSNDAAVLSIISPMTIDTQNRVVNVRALVANVGTTTITSLTAKYSLNGATPVSTSWTGSITSGTIDTVDFASFTVPVDNYSLTVYTELANDSSNANDTITGNFIGLPLVEMRMMELVSPSSACNMGVETLKVRISNHGVSDISSGLSFAYSVNNNQAVVESYTGTFNALDTLEFSFAQTIDMTAGNSDSLFNITFYTIHATDANMLNDTMSDQILSQSLLPTPIISDITSNYGNPATLTAISSDPIKWYINDSITSSFHSGNSYTTPALYDTVTYYLQANSLNPPQTIFTGTSTTTNTPQYNIGPYGSGYFGGTKQAYLFPASELQALGLLPGEIASFSFYLDAAFASTITIPFEMGTTTANAVTGFFTGGTIVANNTFTTSQGWNTHTLTTPFIWDGTSNIFIQFCDNNASSYNPPVRYSTTSYNSAMGVNGMSPGGHCNASSGIARNTRPNVKFVTKSTPGCISLKTSVTVNVPLPQYDGKVNEVLEPQPGCDLASTPVKISIVNMGTDTIMPGFSASYKVDNGAFITPEVINSTILPADTLEYTFTTLASLPAAGISGTNYTIEAKLIYTADTYSANDSVIQDSINSYYTPVNPLVVTPINILYADSAVLTATATDSVYWFDNGMGNNLLGEGVSFTTPNIFDTATYYAASRHTLAQTDYVMGTGTSANPNNAGPSPYGVNSHGARNQYLYRASELKSIGLQEGYIYSVAFDVQVVQSLSLLNFTLKVGQTDAQDLSSFDSTLSTHFYSQNFLPSMGYATKLVLQSPFYWDGKSNLIIETSFKNSSSGNYAIVKNSTTAFISGISAKGTSNWNTTDTTVGATYSKRPNTEFNSLGFGYCLSDFIPVQVNINGLPQLDISAIDFIEPNISSTPTVPTAVKATLKNRGQVVLTSATVTWSENGTVQAPTQWTGSLATGEIDTVTLATNFTLSGGTSIYKAWTSMPNNQTDPYAINDTVTTTLQMCMNGTYTIGLGKDYATFTDAALDLKTLGMCGPVILVADSGYYYESFVLESINGLSATNTLKITSASADSNDVHISYGTTTNFNYVVLIKNSSYITIEGIKISANGGSDGNVISLQGNTHDILIQNNVLKSTNATSGTASAVYAKDADIHHITIHNNRILKGYKALHFEGTLSSRQEGISITHNDISDFSQYGIYLYYQKGSLVQHNQITSAGTSSSSTGIYVYRSEEGLNLSYNILDISANTYATGINLSYTIGTLTNHCKIYNNSAALISDSHNGYNKGIYISQGSYIDVHYNSINAVGGSPTSTSGAALYAYSGNNLIITNNNFATEKGNVLYANSPGAFTSIKNNNYYTDTLVNQKFARWSTVDITTLMDLQILDTANNKNCVSVNPYFTSHSNLIPNSIAINNSGIPISWIADDIAGTTRHATNPDMGAYEFTPLAIDLALINLVYPTQNQCGYQSSDSITVRLRNMGTNNIDFSTSNTAFEAIIQGVNPDTVSFVLNSGTLNSGSEMNVTLTNTYNLSIKGNYIIDVNVAIAGDNNASNDDTQTAEVISYLPIHNFPYDETFETGTNWSFAEETGLDASISVNQQAANSGTYGLHFTGGTYNNWTLASNPTAAFGNTEHLAKAYTCEIDASNINTLKMKFDLKQTYYDLYKEDYSWFRVMLTDSSGIGHYLKEASGDSVFQATHTHLDPFETYTYDLDQYTGQVLKVSFEAACKYSNGTGNYQGDNAYVDNITFWTPNKTDVGTIAIKDANSYGKNGASHTITVAYENYGSDTLYKVPVGYIINNGAPIMDTIAMLIPSKVDTFSFAQTITLNGLHTIKAFAAQPGDSVYFNDTTQTNFKGLNQFTANYSDNFEGYNDWFVSGSNNLWEKGTPSTLNINTTASGTNAYVTDLDNDYTPFSFEYLYTPYLTIPFGTDTAKLEFWHNMSVNVDEGFGVIQYSTDGVYWSYLGNMYTTTASNWYNKIVSSVHCFSLNTNGWVKSSIDLDPSIFPNGQEFQLRFYFVSSSNTNVSDGWAIDDFAVIIPKLAQDAGVAEIINPAVSTTIGDSVSVSVKIKNYGKDTLYSIPVNYAININVTTEVYAGTLLPGDSTIYTFTNKFLAPVSNYPFCAFTTLPTDMQSSNDSICASITSTQSTIDVGINSIHAPGATSIIGTANQVKVMVANYGLNPVTNIPLEFEVLGGIKVYDTLYTTLNSNDSVLFTFTDTYTSSIGVYSLCVRSTLSTDKNPSNDDICKSILGTTDIEDLDPSRFIVNQNIPNPIDMRTKIEVFIPVSDKLQFEVIDITGRRLYQRTEDLNSGSNVIEYNFEFLSAGVYYYSYTFKGIKKTRKMVIVR